MMQVVEKLNRLRLDVLDQDWVQGIYYSEFLEFGEFPSEYESILESLEIKKVFKDIMRSIDNWLNSEDDNDEKSWAALSHHVEHQKLLAILAYYIDYGTKNVVTKEYRNNAILASRLYYKFLSISGYKAYHIYHSQLFAHSLACLGFPKLLCDSEDNYFNTKELTSEVNSIIQELRHFVLDLQAIIDSLQLSPNDMNFEDILSNLVDITGGAIVNKLNIDKIELANISAVIYQIINILICDSNGEPNTAAIQLLFKCILPKLVAASADCKNANNLVRASYVTYSGLILARYGKAALPGYTYLLQYLCYTHDGLERAEARQARVSLVVGLMSLLPRKPYRSIIKWLLKLSDTNKIYHRQVALEMLSKLLSNEPEEEKPEQQNSELQQPPETADAPKEGEGEPAKNGEGEPAKDGEGEPVKNGGEPAKDGEGEPAKDGEGEPAKDGEVPKEGAAPVDNTTPAPLPPPSEITTEDESSQDTQATFENPELTEEEISSITRQRAHTAPYKEILRAVYERVNDTSSTVRTRAFSVLTECLESERAPMKLAIQELNGDGAVSRLMAVAARGVVDERAVVRRAALTLVHRSLAARDAPPPQPHDLGILVGLCRDASIIVRSGAISALGELTLQRPCKAVFDAFLNGPIHQLSDPETKVQDQVVKLVQELLIDRLQKYVEGACEDQLPWMFLAGVTRHNMRKHLLKACGLLAKSTSCISHRLVDVLSTHLGALSDERDLHTLVMLTSVARFVEYKEVNFALEYYYKLADGLKGRDPRLMALTIDLLEAWRRWMGLGARSDLRTHLVRRLTTANDDDGCRLACVTLAGQLDPLDLTWSSELLQLSERVALSSMDVQEWLRAVDMSLVAPAPPSPALLELFIGALTAPPPDWTAESLGVAVAGLGRLCLRSRDAATLAAPVLATVLRDPALPPAPRVNALLALHDVCTRYTCIVEPLLDCVCGCLARDAEPPLRRSAARVLTRLLLAGFLRLRTPLYYRYTCIVEPLLDCVCGCLARDAEPPLRRSAARVLTRLLLAGFLRLRTPLYYRYTCIVEPLLDCVCGCLARDAEPPLRRSAARVLTRLLLAGFLRLRTPLYYRYTCIVEPLLDCVCGCLARDAEPPLRRSAARVLTRLLLAGFLRLRTPLYYRYTCIVEPLLDCVCGCLARDAEPPLRRSAARVLTRLLLAGFLRLRTPLYYRFCALLADEDEDVREPAEYYVTCCLTADTIYHHFVDCVMHYNAHNAETSPESNISFDSRQLIYDVMLQRLSIVQKLNLQCRLAREVLLHAADLTDEGDGDLPPAVNAALLDTISLLCGPRMKLPKKPQRDGDQEGIDDLHERITTNIVSHKMKRTVAEVVVPAVLRLHSRLRARGGQVVAYLVRIANDLLADYRHEIEELIDNDDELVQSVRQFQETIGDEPSFGNTRNLVTTSTTHEPETPKASRKRARAYARSPPRKRALRI